MLITYCKNNGDNKITEREKKEYRELRSLVSSSHSLGDPIYRGNKVYMIESNSRDRDRITNTNSDRDT